MLTSSFEEWVAHIFCVQGRAYTPATLQLSNDL